MPDQHTIQDRLTEAEQVLPTYELTFPSFRSRVSYAVRCRIPIKLKIAAAELLGRVDAIRNREALERARRITEGIVVGTHLEDEVEAIARRRLVENRVSSAGFWRTRWDRDAVLGGEHLHDAVASGRGTMLSFCHIGCFHGSFAPVWTHERRVTYVPTNPWFLVPPDGSDWGFMVEHWRRRLKEIEARVVIMPGTFETLGALLERGEVVMIAFDMPGSRKADFLGKEVDLTAGTANIAFQTGSLVVPTRRRRRGLKLCIEYAPPLDPNDFADAESLQATLVAFHGNWILERPAALEDPNRPGAWENSALPSGWTRPPRSEESC
ncbi:MAG TPA: hypothetical protein VGI67_04910 [Thermoleophilaceae bacterium]